MVTIPIARPTQSLAGLAGKSPPCPQSCWIMNRRTSNPAANGAIAKESQTWQLVEAISIAAHSATNGRTVTASSMIPLVALALR